MIRKLLYIFIIFFASTNSFAKPEYIKEGIDLYNKNKFEDAKFKFEQDIVFNPKSELSYLYLSKIFNKQDKKSLQEKNLNTVILLNPKNEEAIYNLALLNIKKSNFSKSKKLIDTFDKVCKNLCTSKKKLQETLDNSNKK